MENNQQYSDNKLLKQFNSSFDFKRLMGAILSNWYWFVLSISITLTLGYLYLRYTTPKYEINSSLLIDEGNNPAQNVLSNLDNNKSSESSVNLYNEMFILRSQDLIGEVTDSLNLNIRYWAVGRVRKTELYQDCPIKIVFDSAGYKGNFDQLEIKQVVDGQFEVKENKISQRELYDSWITRSFGRFKILYTNGPSVNRGYLTSTSIIVRIQNPTTTSDAILNELRVNISDGRTSLLDLTYTDNIPQRGVDFLNILIHFYQKKELEDINHTAERTREFINQRKQSMIHEIRSMDTMAENIQTSSEMINPTAQSSTFFTEKTASEEKINDILVQKEALNNLKKNVLSNKDQVIAGLGLSDPFLTGLITQYNELIQKLETYQQNYGPENPFLLETQSEIASVRKRIVDAADKVLSSLTITEESSAKNAALNTSRIKSVPEVEANIKDAKREYDALTQIYLYLYQKGVENEISVYAASNKSKLVVVPYPSGEPISPVKKNVYGMVFILGLMVPATFFIVKEMLNNKVINENDIQALTDIPIVGSISNVEANTQREATIVVGPHVRTGVAEQFRLVRANLEFMSASNDKKVYLITSSTSGEGKSFISINLGITMTLAKKRVIIMEFDLRKPKITEYLGLSNEGGISGYLAGINELDKVIKASGVHENLYIANCGPVPPNPGELLVLPSTQKLIEELQEMFDVVILDTAPIGIVSDALILSQYSSINLFIVRQSFTVKDQVRMFNALYHDGKIQHPAVIFNGVEYLKKYGYGYSAGGYSYGYSYGQGYESTINETNKASKGKSSFVRFFTK
ncbi:MAG TPA: polysaccharide biosynthesis tyrosine autokinase [Flavipsychrobacter sp.]|nr:polysaccharide biosynthesis tyrosine autokinase [Flavipsychrobacter sp.]